MRGPANRKDLIARMAADLCTAGAFHSEREALRLLLAKPYRWGDVVALTEEAMFEARQSAVAAEMARP